MSILAIDNLGVIAKTLSPRYSDVQEARTFARGLELYILDDKPLIVTEMVDVHSAMPFQKFVDTIRKKDVRSYTPIIVYTYNINKDNGKEMVARLTGLGVDAIVQQSPHIGAIESLVRWINQLKSEPMEFYGNPQVWLKPKRVI